MFNRQARKRVVLYDGYIGCGEGTMPSGLLNQLTFLKALFKDVPPKHIGDVEVEYRIKKLGGDEDVLVSVYYLRPATKEEAYDEHMSNQQKDIDLYDEAAERLGLFSYEQTLLHFKNLKKYIVREHAASTGDDQELPLRKALTEREIASKMDQAGLMSNGGQVHTVTSNPKKGETNESN